MTLNIFDILLRMFLLKTALLVISVVTNVNGTLNDIFSFTSGTKPGSSRFAVDLSLLYT